MPPLSEQNARSPDILGALDDKIELNRHLNGTLEATARAIFKSWFVDFDPVHAKANGEQPVGMDAEIAALFPDSFEDSPLGAIPAGWGVGTVSDLARLDRESVNPTHQTDEYFWHYSLPAFDDGRMPKLELGNDIKSNKYLVTKGSILLSKLNPQNFKIWFPMQYDDFREIASTEFLVVVPFEQSFREYLYSVVSSEVFVNVFSTLVTGTSSSHQRVKPEYFLDMEIVIAQKELMQLFSQFVQPMFRKVLQIQEESRTLAELRDALLPKLISGEIIVSEALLD